MLPPTLLLAAALLQTQAPFEALSRDLVSYVSDNDADCCMFYYGALSNLGVMLWTFAAAVGVLAGAVFLLMHGGRKLNQTNYRKEAFYYLAAGLISMMFAVDDMFLFHEFVVPFYIRIKEEYVLILYAFLSAAFVIFFFGKILSFSPLFFVLAVLFLSTSLLGDLMKDVFGLNVSYQVEDSAKFIGISAWTAYFFRSACNDLLVVLEQAKTAKN